MIPYNGKQFIFHNPDGEEITVRGWGDQFAAIFETLDGHAIIQNSRDGYYYYATLSDDQKKLVPTNMRIGTSIPESTLPNCDRPSLETMRAIADEKHHEQGKRRWEERIEERRNKQKTLTQREIHNKPDFAGTIGNYLGLCLLVKFLDVPETITQSNIDDFCNKVGYSNFGNNGSVYDYFFSVSDGKLHYNNKVTAYYTTKHPRSYYTDENIGQGIRARELIVEALTSLKENGFDFSKLSSDDQDYIYALNVFYAGDCINNWAKGLWPHSWSLKEPFVVTSNKKFFDYQISDIGRQLTLRTFCHENGHMICGFPDLYDYGGDSRGVGDYSLMAYGGSETNPTQVDAYLKNIAGWTSKLTTLTGGMTISLPAGRNEFLIHKKSDDENEYFILENRQQTGRDTALPDAGLVIWHVDQLGSNNNQEMTSSKHYELSLEQADNQFDLEHNINSGDNKDLYSGVLTSFGYDTSPNSKWWDGADSGLEIEKISNSDQIMTIKVKDSAVPILV